MVSVYLSVPSNKTSEVCCCVTQIKVLQEKLSVILLSLFILFYLTIPTCSLLIVQADQHLDRTLDCTKTQQLQLPALNEWFFSYFKQPH